MRAVRNLITGETIVLPKPIDEEVPYEGGVMITETDPNGIITFANKRFRLMTGYPKEELIGSPHSIVRHPDMPSAAFAHLWQSIKQGHYWRGYIKSLRKDGRYFWAIVWIKPKYDQSGQICGYIANRKVLQRETIEQIREQESQASLQTTHLNLITIPHDPRPALSVAF